MGCIYKYTNSTTQESYIGFTTRDADLRRKEHISGDGNQPLKNDIDKYGEDAFTFDILEDGIIPAFLHEREKYWIAKFDTFHNGYNLTTGGGSSTEVSEETKRKLSEAHIGNTLSKETRRKLSEANKGRKHTAETKQKISDSNSGEKNYQYGKPLPEETKQKISETLKGRSSPMKGKKHTAKTLERMSEAQKGEKNHNYGKIPSEETKQKISDSKKGKKLSVETRRNMSDSRRGEKNHNYGKKFSPEHRKSLSVAKETPERIEARKFFFSLSADMPLSEKRKRLRQKFPKKFHKSIYNWCQKFNSEIATP